MTTRPDQTDAADREMRRRSLEHRIAISAAASDIECYAEDLGRWYDTHRVAPSLGGMGPEFLQTIADAAEYLDLCGLLERHPGNPHIVRIKLEELPSCVRRFDRGRRWT